MNYLYFGDNLDILKKLCLDHPDGVIDLIYIDPPFNSKRNYNVLFEDVDLKDAKAQKEAFADTWSRVSYVETLYEIAAVDKSLYEVLNAFDRTAISKSAISYLATMAIRVWHMRKILKETGSFYLHCDPTMSHYLKIVCDVIFGEDQFRNEIIWKRMTPSGFKGKTDMGTSHDVILRYTKTNNFTYHPIVIAYSDDYLQRRFNKIDEDGRRFKDEKIGTATSQATIDALKTQGKIYITKTGKLRIKHYLDEAVGFPIDDVWTDIPPINSQAQERLGYPTQKPERLLERLLLASSNEGDLVADFFCGCGTTIAVAQKLHRRWFGVDISHLAIKLIVKRLQDTYDTKYDSIRQTFEIHGIPKDIASAKELAANTEKGRLKFQDWVIEFLLGGVSNPKKTADGGWDGHMTFALGKKKEIVLIEVKSGKVNVKQLREFIQVVHAQQAAIGVFVCFEEFITEPMMREAKQQGYYTPSAAALGEYATQFPAMQLLAVERILQGEQVKMPMTTQGVFKTAGKHLQDSTQEELL